MVVSASDDDPLLVNSAGARAQGSGVGFSSRKRRRSSLATESAENTGVERDDNAGGGVRAVDRSERLVEVRAGRRTDTDANRRRRGTRKSKPAGAGLLRNSPSQRGVGPLGKGSLPLQLQDPGRGSLASVEAGKGRAKDRKL